MRNVTVVTKEEQVTHGKVLEINMEAGEFKLRTPSKIIRYPSQDVVRIIDEPADQLYQDIETRLESIEKRLEEIETGR